MRWGKPRAERSSHAAVDSFEPGLCISCNSVQYTLCDVLGSGAHCTVWRCLRVSSVGNRQTLPFSVALKVHNKDPNGLNREAAALKAIHNEIGRCGRWPELFPLVFGSTSALGRTCLVLPAMGPDLYVLQQARRCSPFDIGFVWSLSQQLFEALEVLWDVGLIHADIKPQNVVLHQPVDLHDTLPDPNHSMRITLIDLGSSVKYSELLESTRIMSYVQSRWYRAPEVLLGSECGMALDVWSVGLVIAEAALGLPLLPGESEYNQLRRIASLLGPPPAELVRAASRACVYEQRIQCNDSGHSCAHYTLRPELEIDEPSLVRYLPDASLRQLLKLRQPTVPYALLDGLLRLLHSALTWEPTVRCAPRDALAIICTRGPLMTGLSSTTRGDDGHFGI